MPAGPRVRSVSGVRRRRPSPSRRSPRPAGRRGDRLGHRPAQLSGGQQQRVAGARALASRPQIVFADEPTGNLDSKSGAELLAFLRSAVEDHGQTIVMVTHDPLDALALADRVIVLDGGRIVEQGAAREVLLNPQTEFTRLLTFGLGAV